MNLQSLSKPSKQWTLAVVVGGTALTGIIAFYGISQSKSTSKPVEVVQPRPKIEEVTALGRIEPATEVIKVSVPATLSNDRIAKLLVQRGSGVKAGQAIAIMDSRDRLQNALLEAQAQVKVSQAELAKVQAGAKSGEIAAQKAEADLAEVYIRAPIAGRILDIKAKPGEVVGEKGIAELGQTRSMQAIAEVYQTDIGKVREGQQAKISSESFSQELRGTVRLIGLQVIQQEVTSGEPGENLDRKVIEVRIALDSQDSKRVANLTNLQVQVAIQPNNNIKQ
ncbi:ABC.CD.TX, HlyD family secretion protein (plasmid) [Nostoc flagelliforme CCNUN1]|uniref:ABC.CD.TX, HlyD family secretion protein n=1 Tax=Nostoc flagelliforme CCNUN1 TaxID=2038116 RepID=A0A2K8TB63_9NOSO|nr:HlyD family efflux transporter periplasmic adaptor subunit [Nostoc flagelliforme]AUB44891.1 ABC.CD.TX, HlyD family secretion protein [Nostoc flagelliforme CCNUN1]